MAKRNGADPRQRQLGSIEAEVVSGLLPAGRPSAMPMSVAEFDGWDADDVRQWLDGFTGGFRQLRAVIGLGLWVLRDRSDGEAPYTKAVKELAANFGVNESTLWRWRSAAQAELGLPDPRGIEARVRSSQAGVAARTKNPAKAIGRATRPNEGNEDPEIARETRPNGEAAEQVVARDDTRRAEVQPPAAQAEGSGATGTTVSPRAPGSSSARGAEPPAPPITAKRKATSEARALAEAYVKTRDGHLLDDATADELRAVLRVLVESGEYVVRRKTVPLSVAAGKNDCPHPRDKRRSLGYAAQCGQCGEVLR